ncbi:peptidylglycine alpha-amidating monooxygenase-like isoform X2 [Liolophura sinensis]|uniref:peptidylglycine alpha-amidating monooxygenase-like isoform X2 n=1 Tax=Liolophura sinensis TaxID=3198878 RepID=UPI0031582EC4
MESLYIVVFLWSLMMVPSIRGQVKNTHTLDIKMPGARPAYSDHYLCTTVPVNKGYVVGYKALAEASTAHHILLYACSLPYKYNGVWECGSICNGERGIMFAWAKNAPPLHLPEDVGYQLGDDVNVNYVVMQIHYAHAIAADEQADYSGIQLEISQQRQKYIAGIFLMMSMRSIPPNTPVVHLDVSCKFEGPSAIYPFGYRTHAHALSRVITGYQINDTWHEIGKGNPQWPQAFYPTKDKIVIKPGDKLAARCTYNSTGVGHTVYMGSTANDEMCNFYIMYYTDSTSGMTSGMCSRNNLPSLVKQIPADSDKSLPPNPVMDEIAKGHHHHHGMTGGHDHPSGGREGGTQLTPGPPASEDLTAMVPAPDWPEHDIIIGQVGGVATDKDGNLYVFHRGKRIWAGGSFNVVNRFLHQNDPIKDNTLVKMDRAGRVLRQWGAGQFYMPHGITVDSSGNIWLTDVALHQVFRYPPGSDKPDLVLGERFVPGHDDTHFCKPADVAVLSTGEFFVADGYCNARIIKYSKDGQFLNSWGSTSLGEPAQNDGYPPTNTFNIVHSITVAEEKNLLCASDRENGRIQCYDLEGNFQKQITSPRFGGQVFGVAYCPKEGGMLFAVNGQSPYHKPLANGERIKSQGFSIDLSSGEITGTWQPSNDKKEFSFPHTLAVYGEQEEVYVGEIGPNIVWKFIKASTLQNKHDKGLGDHETMKKGGVHVHENEGHEESTVSGKPQPDEEEENSKASIIIGVLLIVPIALMIVITVLARLHSKGKLRCCAFGKGKKPVFNYFTSHKGFDPLSTEDSDHEVDPLNDSDGEDYSTTPKA